jgi:predicted anti-sigma-YlaC factor YlaD
MICERVFELADGFLDGTLKGEVRAAIVEHLAMCGECRDVMAALRDAPPEDPELTTRILRRTTGPVCDTVRDRLCDWVDATLDPIEATRVGGHLSRCPECAALGRVLTSMRAELSLLAEVDPDPGFVADVLARTSLRPRRAGLAERMWARVSELLERPRIALEGAFVAAMLVGLPFGMRLDRSGVKPGDTAVAIRDASGATSAGLNMLAHAAWGTTRGLLAEYAPRGTFSSAAASDQPSDGTDDFDRKAGSAQEKRR